MRKSNPKKKLTNKELKQIVIEDEMAIIASLPDPKKFHHEFSPEFEAKAQMLIEKARKKEKVRNWWARLWRKRK